MKNDNLPDKTPGELHPVPITQPDLLAMTGALRGIAIAPPSRATILEIACGDGVNLIPMAFHMPETTFVGIDTSVELTAVAQRTIEHLELHNISIICGDLGADDLSKRHFDYVIAHNVLSYVSPGALDEVLRMCNKVLAEHGVAFFSYNTTFAWLQRKALRALIEAYTKHIDPLEKRLSAIRELLEALDGEGLDVNNPFIRAAKFELYYARSLSDNALLENYLSPHCRTFTFSEVTRLMQSYELKVFDEISEPSRTRNQENQLRQALLSCTGDAVSAEDLTEFATAPNMRGIVACHFETIVGPPSPNIPFLDTGFFASPLTSRNDDVLLDPGIEVALTTHGGHLIRSKEPFNKAVLAVLMRAWPEGLPFTKLKEEASALLREAYPDHSELSKDEIEKQATDLLALRAMGGVRWRSRPIEVAADPPPQPKVFAINRWQASRGYTLTNPHHEIVVVDEITRRLVMLLDGTMDSEALESTIHGFFEAGELELKQDEKGTKENLDTLIPRLVQEAITGLVKALLVER